MFRDLNAKLRGYYRYYGVQGNYPSLQQFFNRAMRILFKWLNRRSQRRSYTWPRLHRTAPPLSGRTAAPRRAPENATGHFGSIGRIAEASLPEEPGAGKLHAGICAGAVG